MCVSCWKPIISYSLVHYEEKHVLFHVDFFVHFHQLMFPFFIIYSFYHSMTYMIDLNMGKRPMYHFYPLSIQFDLIRPLWTVRVIVVLFHSLTHSTIQYSTVLLYNRHRSVVIVCEREFISDKMNKCYKKHRDENIIIM